MFSQDMSAENLSQLSQNDSVTASMVDELSKLKSRVSQSLKSEQSVSVDKLKTCSDINPYKQWFMTIIQDADNLQLAMDDEFFRDIESL